MSIGATGMTGAGAAAAGGNAGAAEDGTLPVVAGKGGAVNCPGATGDISGWRCTGGAAVVGTAVTDPAILTGDATALAGGGSTGDGTVGGASEKVGAIGVSGWRCPGVGAVGGTAVAMTGVSGCCTGVAATTVGMVVVSGVSGAAGGTAVTTKSDSPSTGCRCTGPGAGIAVGWGASIGAAGTAVSAISVLVVGLAGGVAAAGCGRETSRPNRCPMRPKREGGAGGVVVDTAGGVTAGAAVADLETVGSAVKTAVFTPGNAAAEGVSCTGGGSGSSTCRCTTGDADGAGAVTTVVGATAGKVGMGVTAVGAVDGCAATLAASIAGDSTGAAIVGLVEGDSGWRWMGGVVEAGTAVVASALAAQSSGVHKKPGTTRPLAGVAVLFPASSWRKITDMPAYRRARFARGFARVNLFSAIAVLEIGRLGN